MEEKEQPKGEPHFVGKKDELIDAKHSVRTLEGRDVLIVYHQGVFYAIDCYCYHAGGNLQNGDIEELGGKVCIICPKHKYKISLAEGEGLYKAKVHGELLPAARWMSKGVKQRVHTVSETNGNIYVKLSDNPSSIESDFYQGEKGKVEREKAEAAEKAKS
ncbi:Rieske domain-containing protein [Thalassophryne amazonica]|uniref:Rieske domain-containing protein n=1 Tax=Thalassophryne amazonica TaxID=390379 RepID=UPI0014709114|nr:Rieske domain-containing protein [Thalassophryne amazonica]XP_034023002.1 Rieske domain-containing protein [Thalassophryne amazonica]XP_034023003.1 Rieske domain-containing protein [Thalassophryne amazonica]